MWAHRFIETLERQEILAALSDRLQPQVSGVFKAGGKPGQAIKNFLNGTWLGHPLHPILKDVPIGAWTMALLFDVVSMDAAADVAIAFGLAGALASAATGAVDWSDTYGRAQRIGVAHAALNLTSTVMYAASLISRKYDRGLGKALSLVGYGFMSAGAYLGGNLVFSEQLGVNHAAQELPREFISVCAETDLPENSPMRVHAKGVPVLLVRAGNNIFALVETCSHLGGPLSEGTLENGSVRCPWHGSRFSLENGAVIDGPATQPQPCLQTRIAKGNIEVRSSR